MTTRSQSFRATLHCMIKGRRYAATTRYDTSALFVPLEDGWLTLSDSEPARELSFQYRNSDQEGKREHYSILVTDSHDVIRATLAKSRNGYAGFYEQAKTDRSFWKLEILDGEFKVGSVIRCMIRDEEGHRLGAEDRLGAWYASVNAEPVEFELKILSMLKTG